VGLVRDDFDPRPEGPRLPKLRASNASAAHQVLRTSGAELKAARAALLLAALVVPLGLRLLVV